VPGFRQQITQQGMDINDSVGGAEERVVKLKPVEKRKALPRLGNRKQFGRHALFAQLGTPFGGRVWLSVSQVQASALAEDGRSVNSPGTEPLHAFNRQLPKDRIRFHLARHRRVAPGGVASGQRFPFENDAARNTSPRQRSGN
jgi:hypothetical protein